MTPSANSYAGVRNPGEGGSERAMGGNKRRFALYSFNMYICILYSKSRVHPSPIDLDRLLYKQDDLHLRLPVQQSINQSINIYIYMYIRMCVRQSRWDKAAALSTACRVLGCAPTFELEKCYEVSNVLFLKLCLLHPFYEPGCQGKATWMWQASSRLPKRMCWEMCVCAVSTSKLSAPSSSCRSVDTNEIWNSGWISEQLWFPQSVELWKGQTKSGHRQAHRIALQWREVGRKGVEVTYLESPSLAGAISVDSSSSSSSFWLGYRR